MNKVYSSWSEKRKKNETEKWMHKNWEVLHPVFAQPFFTYSFNELWEKLTARCLSKSILAVSLFISQALPGKAKKFQFLDIFV